MPLCVVALSRFKHTAADEPGGPGQSWMYDFMQSVTHPVIPQRSHVSQSAAGSPPKHWTPCETRAAGTGSASGAGCWGAHVGLPCQSCWYPWSSQGVTEQFCFLTRAFLKSVTVTEGI